MTKRQLIPAALREELTEYSSLLRALRTTQTLDVTAHLTEPYVKEDESGPSKLATRSKRKRSESPHWRYRDQWTRWPMLAKDVPPPDWSLQDEIAAFVKQVLPATNSEPSPSFPEDDDDDEDSVNDNGNDNDNDNDVDDDDSTSDRPIQVEHEQDSDFELDTDSEDEGDAYYQSLAQKITPVIQNKLESLFALICAHTIARTDGMQNRIEPFDWRDLINILGSPGAAHLVDETVLQNVTSRMEELFETTPASTSTSVPPPSPALAIHRHKLVQSSRSHLNSLLSKHTSSLFEQDLPPPNFHYRTSYQLSFRRRKKKKKQQTHYISTDQDDEDIDETEGDDDFGTSKSKGRTGKDEAQKRDKGKGKAKESLRSNSTLVSKHHSPSDDDEEEKSESESTQDT